MKAIMLMFDSLNRHMLEPYGCKWTSTPNFRRLAEHTAVFDTCYVGSLPCMPARRELQTGRYDILHRSWGPIEPYDICMPELLSRRGIYTHLISDHGHYWEDGGATYHQRYNTWENVRGQEGDHWKPRVCLPETPPHYGKSEPQDEVNRLYIRKREEMPLYQVYGLGLSFLEENWQADNWFLQLESFDPHEPFYLPDSVRAADPDYDGPRFDWPAYGKVTEPREAIAHCRRQYARLLEECDRCIGRVLDFMDAHDMWKDTMLIVNTDHGFLLGEHNWWGKGLMPLYEEIVHTPLFIWDPREGKAGVRRKALVQTIDLAPTLLEFFGVSIPGVMQGKSLRDTIAEDAPVRQYALFGMHGRQVNLTDGRYVYMRAPKRDNSPLYEYTLMPTHMRALFTAEELSGMELAQPFSFTQGLRTMKIPVEQVTNVNGQISDATYQSYLFDLEQDPEQQHPLSDPEVLKVYTGVLCEMMRLSDAPVEQYQRLGL